MLLRRRFIAPSTAGIILASSILLSPRPARHGAQVRIRSGRRPEDVLRNLRHRQALILAARRVGLHRHVQLIMRALARKAGDCRGFAGARAHRRYRPSAELRDNGRRCRRTHPLSADREVDLMGYSVEAKSPCARPFSIPSREETGDRLCTSPRWMVSRDRRGNDEDGPDSARAMTQTPMYQLYAHVAPRPEDWPVLHAKLGEMFKQDYDWSKDVPAIKAPTCLYSVMPMLSAPRMPYSSLSSWAEARRTAAGTDQGIQRPAREFYRLTHYTIFSSPVLASTVTPFLDALMPEAR